MNIGAYAIERDYSHYVANSSNTVLAVIGTATKGPIGEAVVCTSTQDLVNKFGPLRPDCPALYAGQYFLSQASKLYFVRAAYQNKGTVSGLTSTELDAYNASHAPKASSVIVKGTKSSASVDAFTIEYHEKGTYADGFTLLITGTESSNYTLTFKTKAGNLIEKVEGVTLAQLTNSTKPFTTKYFKVSTVTTSDVTGLETTTGSESTVSPKIYTFSGGNDGIADIAAGDFISAATPLLETETIDINLLSVPGQSDSALISAMLTLASNRGDTLYLIDPPQGKDKQGIINWVKNPAGTAPQTPINSDYGAIYYDWVKIYDSVNKQEVMVPPSVVVAATIAYSDYISELWYAPAGLQRGIVRGALSTASNLSKSDVAALYDEGINSIYNDPQVGLVIWGQKTALKTDSALNRVNVRRLLNYLKKVVSAACDYLTFEPNDRLTWNSFEMKIQPVLENIKTKRGLYSYRIVSGETIVTDSEIDNYRMPCLIMIRPTKAAEEIPLYFVITSTGADFNEVLESNGVIYEE